jgi:hypothetical protein
MGDLTPETFTNQLGMLLRDLPRGSVAELTDFAVAYWDSRHVVYAYLRDDCPAQIEEDFDLCDCVWLELRPEFAGWLAAPHFSVRAEVRNWLKDTPPFTVATRR